MPIKPSTRSSQSSSEAAAAAASTPPTSAPESSSASPAGLNHPLNSARKTVSRTRQTDPANHSGSPRLAQRQAVRVLCVDDHAVLIEGLRAQFAIDGRIEIVGQLACAAELLDEVTRVQPEVVLIDIEMPGPDSFEMIDRLRQLHPHVRTIILSAHIRDGYIAAAFKCGATGYFAKSDMLEDICAGIVEAAQQKSGTFVLGPKVQNRCRPQQAQSGPVTQNSLTASEGAKKILTALDSLSPREMEVLRLIGKGLSRNEIAAQLSRSPKTIDGHQERMMRKLAIESRADLMRFAIREGLAEV